METTSTILPRELHGYAIIIQSPGLDSDLKESLAIAIRLIYYSIVLYSFFIGAS